MKVALRTHCMDFVTPLRAWDTDRSWRWCQCDHMGVRWRDGALGLLEVTALHGPDHVRVLGMANTFLDQAIVGNVGLYGTDPGEEWRLLHDTVCEEIPDSYLFHETRRHCWAAIIAVGDTGDVTFVNYSAAWTQRPSPASSTDRAPQS